MKYFTFKIAGIQVNPIGKWKIEFQRNEGQIFWRRYFKGELIFTGTDYDLIRSYGSDCAEIPIEVFCNDSEDVFWEGYFNYPSSFSFDLDDCEAKGTPIITDQYSCIIKNYEKEYMKIGNWAAPTNIDFVNPEDACPPVFTAFADTYFNMIDQLINNAGRMNCGITIKSSFFWEDNFPNGDNYAANYGTNNYVTGIENRLDTLHTWITQTLRIQLGLASTSNQAMLSFRMIEAWMRDRFNTYWYIDENGDLRFEHISFFLPGFAHSDFGTVVYDLTTLMDSYANKSYSWHKNKYSYINEKLYDQEVFEWAHADGIDFIGYPIIYDEDCIIFEKFKEKIFNTPFLFTDLNWADGLVDPSEIIENGFVIFDVDMITQPCGNPSIRFENGSCTGAPAKLNAHLSTCNLMANYFTWNRIFINGDMNAGNILVFDSAQKHIKQIPISFPVCCDDFNPINFITTGLGNGEVYTAVFDADTKFIEVELIY